jgi:hypothetical protein
VRHTCQHNALKLHFIENCSIASSMLADRTCLHVTHTSHSLLFHMRQTGLTILKRICRRFGIPRWPYKKPSKFYESVNHHTRNSNAPRQANHVANNRNYNLEAVGCRLGPTVLVKPRMQQELWQEFREIQTSSELNNVIRPQPVRSLAKTEKDGGYQKLPAATLQALGISCNATNASLLSAAPQQDESKDPGSDEDKNDDGSPGDTTSNGMNVLMSAIDVSGQNDDKPSDGGQGNSADEPQQDIQEQLLIKIIELLASHPEMVTKLSQLLTELNAQTSQCGSQAPPPYEPYVSPSAYWGSHPGPIYRQQLSNSAHYMPLSARHVADVDRTINSIRALDSSGRQPMSALYKNQLARALLNQPRREVFGRGTGFYNNVNTPVGDANGLNGRIQEALLMQVLNNKINQILVPRA